MEAEGSATWFHKLFKLVESGYSQTPELLDSISSELMDICEALTKLDGSHQVKFAEEVGDNPQFLNVLVPFMSQVYYALSNGYDLKCVCYWQFLLRVLANASEKFRLKLVKEGIHFEMLKQLIAPPTSSEHQELLAYFIKMAMRVMLVLIQDRKLRHYLDNCYYVKIVISLLSKRFAIGNMAKLSLAILYWYLDHNQVEETLNLTEFDVTIILKVLSNKVLSEDEEKESWNVLPKDGLLLALKGFCTLRNNCVEFVKQGGISILSTLLHSDDAQKGALVLLWQLSYCIGLEEMGKNTDYLIQEIQCLSIDDNSDLFAIKISVPLSFLRAFPKDDRDCCMYVEMAYKYELYEECLRFCEGVMNKSSNYVSSVISSVTLFHGKASYYIFQKKLRAIKKLPKNSPAYFQEREICFKYAKEVIHLLGVAFDNNSIDDEGSRMLDAATMLALSESFSSNRCLLCRFKQKKLIQSHICPHAVLRDFAETCGTPEGGRPFFVNWPWQPALSGSWKSAGQISVNLLCRNCELILSKNESQFLPRFFRKLYDKNDPSHIEIEQNIEYGEWLYQFLVGLIFRGMAFQYSNSRDDYLNENEVYAVFVQCRKALLASKCGPQVSLYIAPVTTSNEVEHSSSLINLVINQPFQCFFTDMKLVFRDHQLSSHALSYTFKIGMIISTVKFSFADWKTQESSIISPSKGIFRVLKNDDRQQSIPAAIWKTFLIKAEEMEKQILEQPSRKVFPTNETPPTSYMKKIWDAAGQKKSRKTVKSLLELQLKKINYLPGTISISHFHELNDPTGKVELPAEHKILLHSTIPENSEVGNTVFIAVGKGSEFGSDNPYVIFHHYEPGLQTNYGFFFSTKTFEFERHLPDRTPKRFLDEGLQSSGLLKRSKSFISLVLKAKGFRNYHSLQYWIHTKRTPSVLDTKCRYENDSKCWYCNNVCEICLNPIVLGPSCTDSTNTPLLFCSEECYSCFNRAPVPQSIAFSPDDQQNPNRKVPIGHKEFLHLSSCGLLDNGTSGFITSISLCEGDGSKTFPAKQHYVNFHLRTPHFQGFLEFFVNDSFHALNSVSYVGASCNLFEQENEDALKLKAVGIILDIVKGFGGSGVSDFLKKIQLCHMGASLEIGSEKQNTDEQIVAEGCCQDRQDEDGASAVKEDITLESRGTTNNSGSNC